MKNHKQLCHACRYAYVCEAIRKSSNAMHRCRNCNIAISQICHCNTEDPHSDNPMHRVHINEKDCAPTKAHVCEKCGKNAKSEEALRCHMKAAHPKFSCPDCDNMYNIFEDYEAHKDLHRELLPRKNL